MRTPQRTICVGDGKLQASEISQACTSMADGSVTASEPTPIAASVEQVSSASESEALLPPTSKPKEIEVAELAKISRNTYPNVPAVLNISLMQKLGEALGQEFFDALIVKLRYGNDTAAWKVVVPFLRELPPNEAHSYAYLLQRQDFNVTQKEDRAKVMGLRAHGYYSDPVLELGERGFGAGHNVLRMPLRRLRRACAGDPRSRARTSLRQDLPCVPHVGCQAIPTLYGVGTHIGVAIPPPLTVGCPPLEHLFLRDCVQGNFAWRWQTAATSESGVPSGKQKSPRRSRGLGRRLPRGSTILLFRGTSKIRGSCLQRSWKGKAVSGKLRRPQRRSW